MSSVFLDTAIDVSTLLFAIFGLVINLTVVLVFYRRPSLRSPSNRFVGSLVLANLLSCGGLAPCLVAPGAELAASCLTALVATASVFSTVTIALDRYAAVLSPLHYGMTVTRSRSAAVISLSWCLSCALASPYLFVPCTNFPFWQIHSIGLVILGYIIPLLALVLIYARMYSAAHSNSARTRRHSMCGGCDSGSDIQRRTSNCTFSALLFREEGKAIKTALMVVGSFALSWTPYFLETADRALTWRIDLYAPLVRLSVLSSAFFSPLVYVFRNELVRKELRKMVCWVGRSKVPETPILNGANGHTANSDQYHHPRSLLKHQSSSQCDTISVQSFQVATPLPDCPHVGSPPQPSADFVATYQQIGGDSSKYESITFKLAAVRRCQTCIRQNSDSSTGSSHPLLTPRRQPSSSEPSTPRHIVNNNQDSSLQTVFKFQMSEDLPEVSSVNTKHRKLGRRVAIEAEEPITDV